MYDELEWMAVQAEVLYVHDPRGRLQRINETGKLLPVPRLFWGYTRQGSILRFHRNLSLSVVTDVKRIMEKEEDLPFYGLLEEARRCLRQNGEIKKEWMGPAYILLSESAGISPSKAVQVTADNQSCLEEGFGTLLKELPYRQPCFMIIEEGKAVSVCYSSRQTIRAAEAGVETLGPYRGKGCAVEAAAAWAAAVRRSGRWALYSTSWDNKASQSVAERLKAYRYGTDVSIY